MLNMVVIAASIVRTFSFGDVSIDCQEPGGWKIELSRETEPDGAEIARIVCTSPAAAKPPRFTVKTSLPQKDATDKWFVDTDDCGMPAIWCSENGTDVAHGMPLYVFFNQRDQAAVTIAASECVRRVEFRAGVIEENDRIGLEATYFTRPEAPMVKYETCLRYSTRTRPFADAVRAETDWILKAAGIVPCKVPEAAFEPLYSSWYNFHQNVFAKDVEEECAIASKLGMKTIILDDGWQTDDNARGYAYCGDWQVSKRRFPDFAAHVKKVHEMGLKYMVWYSVPFIGLKSANYERFKGKYLVENLRNMNAAVLDPRFPEVRKFLVDTYVKALRDYDLDGFKLDFIDSFSTWGPDPAEKENYAGRDVKSVPCAVDLLMTDVYETLKAIKPDILIEFRQRYDGPAIRRFGNMIRVGDCPGNMRRNRFAIANLRLVSGGTAVHSDMLEWNYADTPESAAQYIINSIFGVVQYSVMLRNAPEAHKAVIAKWIKFSQDHRETLLRGTFTPRHPELQYPVIEAESAAERIIGVYDDGRVVDLPSDAKPTYLMNASGRNAVTVRRAGKVFDVACASGDFALVPGAAARAVRAADPFVEGLLAKMTLEEKVGQCVQLSSSGAGGANAAESRELTGVALPKDAAEWVKNGEVGSLIGCCGIEKFNAFQKIAREQSRLGIPLLIGQDMIHGCMTEYPIGPALACLWDEETWSRCGRIIALETPLKGANWTFAPMLDMARDPRWGRIAEGPGQDPLIGSKMGAALVRSIQSRDVATPIAACLKHYVGYGASFAGRDYFAVEMSESTLRNEYLPPFKAAVAAGALTVMPAFHTFNGVPCSVNRWLLTDILRGELGFGGFCISDWNGVGECQWTACHGLAVNNETDVSAMAVRAGMDMDMMSGSYRKGLAQAVRKGLLPMAELDEAVRRILTVKKALGLFENPYIDEAKVKAQVDFKAHAAIARDAGARCCVLLKNEKGTLPLKKGAKVLLTGPGAEDQFNLSGAWTAFLDNKSCMFITDGLRDGGVDFTYVPGYDFKKPGVDAKAIREAAEKADVIVAIFGEHGYASGEGMSILRLELPDVQLEALRLLKSFGKPVVALLSGGRPRAIPELAREADAILDVWSLGTSAGGAIADVLTGKVNPEGRLSVEIPHSTGQLPLFYNRTATGRPTEDVAARCASCYQDGRFQALYPFGYGLSYTTFAYANEKVGVVGDTVVFEADVTNTGRVPGVETVQAYTRDLVGRESRPVRELRGWQRLSLKPGETGHAKIAVPVGDLAYWAKDELVPAEGEHWAWIAHDSVSGKKLVFALAK